MKWDLTKHLKVKFQATIVKDGSGFKGLYSSQIGIFPN